MMNLILEMQQIFLNIFFHTFGQILRYVFKFKGPFREKSGKNLQDSFYCLKSIWRVLATICNKQNQNRSIRTGEQPGIGAQRHYAGPMTSRDVIGLPPVTISLVTLYNCFLTVEDYTKDTQEIS